MAAYRHPDIVRRVAAGRSGPRGRWGGRVCAALLCLLALLGAQPALAGPQVRVVIVGVASEIRENIEAFMDLAALQHTAGIRELLRGEATPKTKEPISEALVRRLYAKAPEQIREAMRPFGYYQPTIRPSLRREDETWIAHFDIDPGDPVQVHAVDVGVEGEGREDPALRKVLRRLPLKAGEVLDHRRYDKAKEELLRVALREGYLDAAYRVHSLRVDPVARQAEIHLVLDTGQRYYFGPITIQQDILDPAFVQGYVRIRPGEPYSTERLLSLQSALAGSDYFASVEVHPDRSAARGKRVPVVVKTVPRKPRRYAIGAGFSTDTGPRVNATAKFRRVNRRGHQVVLSTGASPIKQALSSQYRIPIANLRKDRFIVTGLVEHEKIDEGDTNRYSLGVSYDRGWLGAQTRLYANLSHDDFDLGADKDTVVFLIPGFNVSAVRADNVLFARKGASWSLDLRGGAQNLLSETSFVRAETALRGVVPLGERGRLLGRLRVGGMEVDRFSQLPTLERFYAGGDQSVRGYDYRALGPKGSDGKNVGGEFLLTGSVEVDYLVYKDYGVAAFFDAGNADHNFPTDLAKGVGVGLRWRTPAGMAKLDFAWPLDEGASFRIHISFGSGL